MPGIRTDLALEVREMLGSAKTELDGIISETQSFDNELTVTRVEITNEIGERQMNKSCGLYITIEAKKLRSRDQIVEEHAMELLADELKKLIGNMDDGFTTLVVGLGNWNVTPDSLGPKAVEKTMITRHIAEYLPDQLDGRLRPVCGISPGVLGLTGMETGEVIRSVAEAIKPNLIIAIDALASRSSDRISTTIQLTNTGINPGSGIGNRRMAISREELGVPVIAIGVPMVVYAATIARDALEHMIAQSGSEEEYGDERLDNLVSSVISDALGDLVVTPKEIDVLIDDISRVISGGLNLALHKDVDLEFVRRFMH